MGKSRGRAGAFYCLRHVCLRTHAHTYIRKRVFAIGDRRCTLRLMEGNIPRGHFHVSSWKDTRYDRGDFWRTHMAGFVIPRIGEDIHFCSPDCRNRSSTDRYARGITRLSVPIDQSVSRYPSTMVLHFNVAGEVSLSLGESV